MNNFDSHDCEERRAAFKQEVSRQLYDLACRLPAAQLHQDADDTLSLTLPHRGATELHLRIVYDESLERFGVRLLAQTPESDEELLCLSWPEAHTEPYSQPDRPGLLAHAPVRSGRYASGAALHQLLKDLGREGHSAGFAPTSYALAVNTVQAVSRKSTPLHPIASPSPTHRCDAPDTAGSDDADFPSLIEDILHLLPQEMRKADAAFRTFINASARSGGRPHIDELPAFTERTMSEMIASYDAYLNGRSSLTAAGVGARHLALGLGLAVALSTETMTGVFVFVPIIGSSLVAAPMAGVGAFLPGRRATVPLTRGKWARGAALSVSMAWAVAVSSLTARNPQLAEPMQSVIPGYHAIAPDLRIARDTARSGLSLAILRETDARTGLLQSKQLETGASRKWQSSVKSSGEALTEAERLRAHAEERWAAAEAQWKAALETHETRRMAEIVLFVLTTIMNAVGPIVLSLYPGRREQVHAEGLEEARRRRKLDTDFAALKKRQGTQESIARLILADMRQAYITALIRERGLSPVHANDKAEETFRPMTAIVQKAVDSLRNAQSLRRASWPSPTQG